MADFFLKLSSLKLDVSLGVSEQERKNRQIIELNIKLCFNQAPTACFTDDINDTLCYDDLCQTIVNYCSNRSFNLIEHLAYQLANLIKDNTNIANVLVQVTKFNPLGNNLLPEVSFTCGS